MKGKSVLGYPDKTLVSSTNNAEVHSGKIDTGTIGFAQVTMTAMFHGLEQVSMQQA